VATHGEGLLDSVITRNAEYHPDPMGIVANLSLALIAGLALRVAQLRLRNRRSARIFNSGISN
jgi:hypothetical protein